MTKTTCYCSLTVIMMTVLKFEALHLCMNKQFQKRDLLDIWSLIHYTPNKNNPNKKHCADLSHLGSLASVINLLLDLNLHASGLLNLILELLPLAVPHLGFLSHTFLPLGCLLLGSCRFCCTQLCCLHLSPYLGILCLQPLHLSICFVHLIIFFVLLAWSRNFQNWMLVPVWISHAVILINQPYHFIFATGCQNSAQSTAHRGTQFHSF